MKLIFLLSLFIFTSCGALQYQPKDNFNGGGGYSEEKLTSNRYIVTFQGNGHNTPAQVYKYFLRRSAEIAKANSYEYFRVVKDSPGTMNNGSASWPNHTGEILLTKDSKSSYAIAEILEAAHPNN